MLERIHLQIILETHRLGSLTSAAKALHLTQSALSHSMRKLEQEMGVAGKGESNSTEAASLFSEIRLSDHERMVLERLRQDEATQLDELIEVLEGELGSAEIFTALFELELAGRVKQLPGKNYVRSM